jgi:hypothetical protein
MKGVFGVTIILIAVLLAVGSCRKFESGYPGVTTYSYQSPIINPPDTFMIVYNFSAYGDKTAVLTLDTVGVWRIERISERRLNVSVINEASESFIINIADTLGLSGNANYKVVARNLSSQVEYSNFYLLFTKLNIPFETFEPKL